MKTALQRNDDCWSAFQGVDSLLQIGNFGTDWPACNRCSRIWQTAICSVFNCKAGRRAQYMSPENVASSGVSSKHISYLPVLVAVIWVLGLMACD